MPCYHRIDSCGELKDQTSRKLLQQRNLPPSPLLLPLCGHCWYSAASLRHLEHSARDVGLHRPEHAATQEWAEKVRPLRHHHLPGAVQHGHLGYETAAAAAPAAAGACSAAAAAAAADASTLLPPQASTSRLSAMWTSRRSWASRVCASSSSAHACAPRTPAAKLWCRRRQRRYARCLHCIVLAASAVSSNGCACA